MRPRPSLILLYGDVELHFDRQNGHRLFLVYSDAGEALCIRFEPALYGSLTAIAGVPEASIPAFEAESPSGIGMWIAPASGLNSPSAASGIC